MPTRLTIWWTVLQISIGDRLVYRGNYALGTLMRFLPIITQIFLWGAVFDAITDSSGDIAGYNHQDFIAYYLLTMVVRAFSSMPGLASGIARDIRDGTVKKYLIQPIDMISFLLAHRIAHKLVYYMVAIIPFAAVFLVCHGYFSGVQTDPVTVAAFIASLLMAFLLGFFLESTIGMIGFWWLEVSSLLFVYMLFSFFFSGHMFPIDMLPSPWDDIVRLIPLQYLAYFPAAVFLGKITGWSLVWGLCMQAGWVVFFMTTSRLAFRFGVRRYSGYGG